jgi:hypothetical protein
VDTRTHTSDWRIAPGGGLRLAVRRSATVLAFGVVPVLMLAAYLAGSVHHDPAYDFRAVWQAGRNVLDQTSPYPTVEHLTHLRGTAIDEFVYPAIVAVAAAPLGMIPFGAAAVVWTIVLIAATALSLRVVGVRDWRCYGAFLACPATLDAIRLGTLTPVLAVLVAAAWRWRDSPRRCGALVALAIVAKLFLAPLVIWLVVTRRFAAAAFAAAWCAVLIAAGWALIGLAGLHDYPRLLSTLSDLEAARSYSVSALLTASGLDIGPVALTVTLVGLGSLAVLAARRRLDDTAAYACTIAVALLATPILWLHYLMLAAIMVALRRPAFGAAWLIGWMMWVSPLPESGSDSWRIAAGLCVVLGSAVAAIRVPAAGDR